jgi:hypothetical protein
MFLPGMAHFSCTGCPKLGVRDAGPGDITISLVPVYLCIHVNYQVLLQQDDHVLRNCRLGITLNSIQCILKS